MMGGVVKSETVPTLELSRLEHSLDMAIECQPRWYTSQQLKQHVATVAAAGWP